MTFHSAIPALRSTARRFGLGPPSGSRTIATTSAKSEWLVIIPDKPGSLATRFAVRPTHLKGVEPFRDSGVWKMGGPILHELPKNDEPSSLKIHGSTIVCVAESKEEILEMLKKDVYVERGVWDLDRVQMWPEPLSRDGTSEHFTLLSAEVPSDIWQTLELTLTDCQEIMSLVHI